LEKTAHPITKLKRHEWERRVRRVIHAGRGYQSSVYLVEVEGALAAVKDFAAAPPSFRRWIAPFLIRREMRALRHLRGTSGVPEVYGRLDRYAFAQEYIEGKPIADFEEGELDPSVFPRVQQVIDAIHARGVSHGDLKRRSNLLITPAGGVYLVDFAASIIARPGTRWLQKQVALVDDKALPRIKKFAAPELLSEDDRHKLENPTGLEKWVRRLLKR
jgi:predicted Ser/Thr protein kinase